jgi:sugar phosphate isomerase/epimerase
MRRVSSEDLPLVGSTAAGLGPDLYENLAWLLENGILGVELSVASWAVETNRLVHRQTDLERLKAALEPFKRVTLHATYHNQSGLSLLSWCEPVRNAYFEELSFNLELARKIGAELVTFHSGAPYRSTPYQEIYRTESFFEEVLAVELRRLDRLYAGSGILLGLENADYFQPAEYFEFYRSLGLEAVKIALDTNHMSKPHAGHRVHDTGYNAYEKYGSIAGFVRAFGADIAHVHLNDYDPDNCVGCGHLPVGEGRVDLPGIISALVKVGFGGTLSLELKDRAEVLLAKKRAEAILLGISG